jgi:Galactose oxidase, central domain
MGVNGALWLLEPNPPPHFDGHRRLVGAAGARAARRLRCDSDRPLVFGGNGRAADNNELGACVAVLCLCDLGRRCSHRPTASRCASRRCRATTMRRVRAPATRCAPAPAAMWQCYLAATTASAILATWPAPCACSGHTATLVDSWMIVIGGCAGADRYFGDAHVLQLRTMTWRRASPSGDAPPPLQGHSIYVCGGMTAHSAACCQSSTGSTCARCAGACQASTAARHPRGAWGTPPLPSHQRRSPTAATAVSHRKAFATTSSKCKLTSITFVRCIGAFDSESHCEKKVTIWHQQHW